ncbi:diguanylate cyclase [Bacillus sp. Cr_A10]|uniref:sensor domain-containing protein n=1 Tax=Bacillus sp. Cr_A10 TaxID=3033993 RepID=UPI0023DCA53A|nr:diguanylate cyclase [Bacillus sp. Cr_A10]MDF2067287.1 diguanylate cyclase [Bacillus sp. Cr_A10]
MIKKSMELSFIKVLMEGIQEMVFVMEVGEDTNFYYAFFNKAAMETIRLDQKAIGRTFREVHDFDKASLLEAQYTKVLKTGEPVTFEATYTNINGEIRNGKSTLTPIFNEDGSFTHITSITQDITNEKIAETDRDVTKNRLVKAESQYRSLFYKNSDAIFTMDLHGHILGGNKTSEKLSKYSIGELIGRNFIEFVDPKDRESANTYFTESINGDLKDYRLNFVDKTGERIGCLVKFIPIHLHHIISGIYVIVKDMRELDKLVSKYVESEQIFRIITENVHDVVIMMNHNKEYLYVSPSSREVFGYDYENNSNQIPSINIHANDIKLFENRFEQSIRHAKPFQIQLRAKHETKGWIWTEISGSPVYSDEHQFQFMVMTARDISIQKEYEKKLEYFAYHDSLTGLPNRRFLSDRFSELLKGKKTGITIIFLDIDNFKCINDVWGHDIGDLVIQEFSKRLSQSIESHDIAARLGGDEFIVMLPFVENEEEAIKAAEKIQRVMEGTWNVEHAELTITISMGIALSTQDNITDSVMLRNADLAMYEAKRAGKNLYKVKRF